MASVSREHYRNYAYCGYFARDTFSELAQRGLVKNPAVPFRESPGWPARRRAYKTRERVRPRLLHKLFSSVVWEGRGIYITGDSCGVQNYATVSIV